MFKFLYISFFTQLLKRWWHATSLLYTQLIGQTSTDNTESNYSPQNDEHDPESNVLQNINTNRHLEDIQLNTSHKQAHQTSSSPSTIQQDEAWLTQKDPFQLTRQNSPSSPIASDKDISPSPSSSPNVSEKSEISPSAPVTNQETSSNQQHKANQSNQATQSQKRKKTHTKLVDHRKKNKKKGNKKKTSQKKKNKPVPTQSQTASSHQSKASKSSIPFNQSFPQQNSNAFPTTTNNRLNTPIISRHASHSNSNQSLLFQSYLSSLEKLIHIQNQSIKKYEVFMKQFKEHYGKDAFHPDELDAWWFNLNRTQNYVLERSVARQSVATDLLAPQPSNHHASRVQYKSTHSHVPLSSLEQYKTSYSTLVDQMTEQGDDRHTRSHKKPSTHTSPHDSKMDQSQKPKVESSLDQKTAQSIPTDQSTKDESIHDHSMNQSNDQASSSINDHESDQQDHSQSFDQSIDQKLHTDWDPLSSMERDEVFPSSYDIDPSKDVSYSILSEDDLKAHPSIAFTTFEQELNLGNTQTKTNRQMDLNKIEVRTRDRRRDQSDSMSHSHSVSWSYRDSVDQSVIYTASKDHTYSQDTSKYRLKLKSAKSSRRKERMAK